MKKVAADVVYKNNPAPNNVKKNIIRLIDPFL